MQPVDSGPFDGDRNGKTETKQERNRGNSGMEKPPGFSEHQPSAGMDDQQDHAITKSRNEAVP